MVLRRLNKWDVFIGIYVLYMLQGALYPAGVINQLLQVVMILMAAVVSWRLLLPSTKYPKIINAVSLLVIMYVVYGGLIIIFNRKYMFWEAGSLAGSMSTPHVYLQNSLNSLLPIFFFYIGSITHKINFPRLKIYFFIFLGLVIWKFIDNYNQLLAAAILRESTRTEFTNNMGYTFVALLAFIPLFRKLWVRYALLALCMIFILTSLKRGAILIGALVSIYFLWKDFRTAKTRGNKTAVGFCILVLIIAGTWYVEKSYSESAYFRTRVEQTKKGDTSNRGDIQGKIWNSFWKDESIVHLIFGNGADSTIESGGNYAHQDWVETLYDTGLVGIALLLNFFVAFFILCRKSQRFLSAPEVIALWILFLATFAQTIFSMSIQGLAPSKTLLLGYMIAQITLAKNNITSLTQEKKMPKGIELVNANRPNMLGKI